MGYVIETIDFPSGITSLYSDSTRISISAGSKQVHLYSKLSGHIKELGSHTKPCRASRHVGDRLLSGSMDHSVKLWKIELH